MVIVESDAQDSPVRGELVLGAIEEEVLLPQGLAAEWREKGDDPAVGGAVRKA